MVSADCQVVDEILDSRDEIPGRCVLTIFND